MDGTRYTKGVKRRAGDIVLKTILYLIALATVAITTLHIFSGGYLSESDQTGCVIAFACAAVVFVIAMCVDAEDDYYASAEFGGNLLIQEKCGRDYNITVNHMPRAYGKRPIDELPQTIQRSLVEKMPRKCNYLETTLPDNRKLQMVFGNRPEQTHVFVDGYCIVRDDSISLGVIEYVYKPKPAPEAASRPTSVKPVAPTEAPATVKPAPAVTASTAPSAPEIMAAKKHVSMEIVCSNCGEKLKEFSKFCPNCAAPSSEFIMK